MARGYAAFLGAFPWDYGGAPPESLLARAFAADDQALRYDPNSSDAWMARAALLAVGDPRTFEGGRVAFERAIALDPGNAEAHHSYAAYLRVLGDDSGAATAYHRALAIEPQRAISLQGLGWLNLTERRYAEALRWLDSAIAVDPGFYLAFVRRARVHLLLDQTAEARSDAETAVRLGAGGRLSGQTVLALVEGRRGGTPAARRRGGRVLPGLPNPRRPRPGRGPRGARFGGGPGPRFHSRTSGRAPFVAPPVGPPPLPSPPPQSPDGSPPPCRGAARPAAPAANSVAVLYFDNLSPDTTDAYLADGLTEEVASRLGDIRRLLVKQASRETVRRLRESTPDYRISMGHAMAVRYLVEGSLRRAGPRVRVVARLVNAENGFRTWGATYDRAAADLLSLQEDIAREVATAIGGQLAPAERTALGGRPTGNPDAYEHFLRGNYYLAKRSASALTRAVEEYEAASRLDP